MNSLLAQTPNTFSFDTSFLVLAGVVAVLCGGMYAIRRRHPLASIAIGLLSALLAAFIVLASRYDPEFVMVSVCLLVVCFGCSVVSGIWQLGRRAGAQGR